MAVIMDGKALSAKKREKIKARISDRGIEPCLAVILVGDDPASKIYVGNKKKACEQVGIRSEQYFLPSDASSDQLLALIRKLNADKRVNGILCQLPLPGDLDEKTVIGAIDPRKDVDAFSAENVGHIMIGDQVFLPCTPAGIMELLHEYGVDPAGKSCVVVGRSNIVGKPMAMLLLQEHGTVTICHSRTRDLSSFTRSADILVAAVGKPKFITSDMVGNGAVVIDVGMDRDENGKLCGDVDYQNVEPKASYITPVPGGVGPMTITMLLENTLKAYDLQNGGSI